MEKDNRNFMHELTEPMCSDVLCFAKLVLLRCRITAEGSTSSRWIFFNTVPGKLHSSVVGFLDNMKKY